MTPREKLIEKAMNAYLTAFVSTKNERFNIKPRIDDLEKCVKSGVIAIIDYLKLEVVDNDIIHGIEHCVPEKPVINVDNL